MRFVCACGGNGGFAQIPAAELWCESQSSHLAVTKLCKDVCLNGEPFYCVFESSMRLMLRLALGIPSLQDKLEGFFSSGIGTMD